MQPDQNKYRKAQDESRQNEMQFPHPGLPCWLTVKHLPAAGRPRFDPWVGRSPGGGSGNPLQYSCLENPMDGGAGEAMVRGDAESQTRLSNFTSLPLPDLSSLFSLIPQRTTFNILVASLGIDVSISTYDL